MNYKAEDIKPKRYPDEKPNIYKVYWVHDKEVNHWIKALGKYIITTRYADSFIDIPGAPPELKPLKYPENKPEQVGEERELVDRRGKVRYIAKIIKVTRDKVTYRKVA